MTRIKQTATKKPVKNQVQISRKAIKTVAIPGHHAAKKTIIKISPSLQSRDSIARRVKSRLQQVNRFAIISIPKRPFQKLVRDIAQSFIHDVKFQSEAVYALQQAADDFLVGYFDDGLQCQLHAKRKTLMIKDLQLVRKLRRIEHWAPI